jgi:hypothetical protein
MLAPEYLSVRCKEVLVRSVVTLQPELVVTSKPAYGWRRDCFTLPQSALAIVSQVCPVSGGGAQP